MIICATVITLVLACLALTKSSIQAGEEGNNVDTCEALEEDNSHSLFQNVPEEVQERIVEILEQDPLPDLSPTKRLYRAGEGMIFALISLCGYPVGQEECLLTMAGKPGTLPALQ